MKEIFGDLPNFETFVAIFENFDHYRKFAEMALNLAGKLISGDAGIIKKFLEKEMPSGTGELSGHIIAFLLKEILEAARYLS